MNELELNTVNENLYDDAKIYWQPNKDYSSRLCDRLLSLGYEIKRSGQVIYMIDLQGLTIASGVGKVDFLRRLAHMMQ